MKQIILLLITSILLQNCNRFGNTDEKTNNEERIVVISKQYSEIIYALGAQKNVVAVDISSTYPAEIKKLPTVGYHRALTIEGILATKPSLILHDNNIGPEHVVKQLDDLKIPIKTFSKSSNLDSTKILIQEMGKYFHKESQADSLCNKLDKEMAIALENAKQYKDSVNVLLIHYGQASNVYLVMTKKSTAAKMIEWAGGKFAVDDAKGMKQLSAEVIAAADPEVILLTDFGYDKLGTKEKINQLPGVSGTKAAKNNKIYRIEEQDLVYFGPRTGENTIKLQKLIHGK